MLSTVPDGEDLVIISGDSDYCSPLDKNEIDEYLSYEWETKKSKVKLYRRLSLFFKENFPDIELSQENKKASLISKLAKSESFAQTHSLIAELSTFPTLLWPIWRI